MIYYFFLFPLYDTPTLNGMAEWSPLAYTVYSLFFCLFEMSHNNKDSWLTKKRRGMHVL